MFYTYILVNPKGIFYKGSTDNPKRRITDEHNSNKYRSYTRGKGPWKLFYLEAFFTREEARERELFFKSRAGWGFIKELEIDKSNGKIIWPEL